MFPRRPDHLLGSRHEHARPAGISGGDSTAVQKTHEGQMARIVVARLDDEGHCQAPAPQG